MIRPTNSSLKVYLYSSPVDMRKQVDGLHAIVESELPVDVFSRSLFVFVNKRKDKLKILCWEKNGFVIWYKRLEKETFRWSKTQETDSSVITVKELNWLLDGYDIFNFKPHQPLKISAGM